MFQKFLTDTIQSKFIKNILSNTQIPLCKTVSVGDYIVEGTFYVFNHNYIYCTKSGVLVDATKCPLHTYYNHKSDYSVMLDLSSVAEFDNIDTFILGEYKQNLTENFISSYSYYDTDTHIHLGNYLRALRDVKGLNLMPFYNCVSDKYLSTLRLYANGYLTYGANDRFKILAIPIKFNRIYTVALDCRDEFLTMPLILSHESLVKTSINGTNTVVSDLLNRGIESWSHCDFLHPFQYLITNDNPILEKYENNLYLILQIPISNQSTITVLEGDYTNKPERKIFNREGIFDRNEQEMDRLFISRLSLLKMSDKNTYAFSDRLIEYLTLNVINSTETIAPNISDIQTKYTHLVPLHRSTFGVWDNRLRDDLWTSYMNSSAMEKIDITGNVDKDMEKFLMRGYN